MLTSLAYLFLLGLLLSSLFQKLRLPGLLGMLFTGILLGPYALNLLDPSLLGISADLRQLALVIILLRAGLSLKLEDLRRVGRPAILMCFVPACFEIVGVVLLAPPLLGVSYLEAAVMGSVLAAVSPAVVVPRMLKLMEEGRGTAKSIPQLILTGASVDDVFVIVLFTSFTSLASSGSFSAAAVLQIPVSIVLGILVGAVAGLLLFLLFRRFHMRDSAKVLILLSAALLLVALEKSVKQWVPFSGLLASMTLGVVLLARSEKLAARLSSKFSKLWVGAELLLFVLVGAEVDPGYALAAGGAAVVLIAGALLFRMAGVFLCVLGTKLQAKEKLFCMLAYLPKATVQAAIGSIPLAMGLPCGQAVLTVAVLAILVTAPLGALAIDIGGRKLLEQNE